MCNLGFGRFSLGLVHFGFRSDMEPGHFLPGDPMARLTSDPVTLWPGDLAACLIYYVPPTYTYSQNHSFICLCNQIKWTEKQTINHDSVDIYTTKFYTNKCHFS